MRTLTLNIALRPLAWSANRLAAGIWALVAMRAVARERRMLQQLDDRALRDIGLSRADVDRELRHPLWQLPPSRLR